MLNNELVRRSRNGDVGAFQELFHLHQRRVFSIARQILADESDAADVTQEVFVKAFQSMRKLRSDAAFLTWLKTLTVNLCRDRLRKRKTVRLESLDAPLATETQEQLQREIGDWSDNPEKSLGRSETKESVQRAIETLSPQYREVIALFYLDDLEVQEIARILRVPVGTVKSRLSRARSELRRKLSPLMES